MCWKHFKSGPTKPYDGNPFRNIANTQELSNISNQEELRNYFTHHTEADAT